MYFFESVPFCEERFIGKIDGFTISPNSFTVHHYSRARNHCDEDCKRRLNLDKVSVKVCVKANCEFLKVQEGDRLLHIPSPLNCLKYVEEARGKHKPTRYSRERRIYRRGAVGGWHYRDV